MRWLVFRPLREWLSSLLALRSVHLWLSLFLLGLGFWTVGKGVTLRVVNRSDPSPIYFIADVEAENTSQIQISSIQVKIYKESGISTVDVISDDPNLLEHKFELDLVAPKDIEDAIAQKLAIPVTDVKSLIYYKVRSR